MAGEMTNIRQLDQMLLVGTNIRTYLRDHDICLTKENCANERQITTEL
jgi:hypothetical protein